MTTKIIFPSGKNMHEIRSLASGLHFTKESLSKGERELLSMVEDLIALIDDLAGDYFEGYPKELGKYSPKKTKFIIL